MDPEHRSYKHQYSNIYFVRLVELRPVVEERQRSDGVVSEVRCAWNGFAESRC